MRLNNRLTKNDNIIGFFGSFIQNDSFSLILQRADKGSLWQYFKNTKQPNTLDDVRWFWRSLFDVLRGLHCVHCIRIEYHDDWDENMDDKADYRG